MTKLGSVLAPLNQAKGLGNEHYIDPKTYQEERQAVLFNNWSGIGFGKDVPEAGDAMPINFVGMPLLIVRDKAGEIHVYQNTCRHRGMILVSEKTKIGGVIRCPYHSWCYSHQGDLVTTPHVGGAGQNTHPDVDRDTLGLIRIRSYVWRDVIFVNISRNAPEFTVYAADIMKRWAEFDQPIFHGGDSSSFQLNVKTNWKLAVENYCESYHLPWVHPGLNSYSRLEDHYHIENPGAFSGQGTLVYQQLKSTEGTKFPDHESLSEKWEAGAEYVAFYPNVLLGVHRDHSFAIVLEANGHDQTAEHIELYYAEDIKDQPEFQNLLIKNAKLWKTVFQEDVFVVEGMQAGRHGIEFDGGKFSPAMDGPTHLFHHWVASQIQNHRSAPNGS